MSRLLEDQQQRKPKDDKMQRRLPEIQGKKGAGKHQVRKRAEKMPDMRDIHRIGGVVVPLLRLQAQNHAQKQGIQGKVQKGKSREKTIRLENNDKTV